MTHYSDIDNKLLNKQVKKKITRNIFLIPVLGKDGQVIDLVAIFMSKMLHWNMLLCQSQNISLKSVIQSWPSGQYDSHIKKQNFSSFKFHFTKIWKRLFSFHYGIFQNKTLFLFILLILADYYLKKTCWEILCLRMVFNEWPHIISHLNLVLVWCADNFSIMYSYYISYALCTPTYLCLS